MSLSEQLTEGAACLGIELALPARQKLLDYLQLLEKWNRVYRLTAIADSAQAVSHHLLDSLAVLPFVGGTPLLDVGSGGGMPGIPLAIVRPELQVVLVDSNSKKAAFLQQAAIELALGNLAVHCRRVEALQPSGRFAAITARAFADLGTLVSSSRHLLRTGGRDGRPLAGDEGAAAGRGDRAVAGRDPRRRRASPGGTRGWRRAPSGGDRE